MAERYPKPDEKMTWTERVRKMGPVHSYEVRQLQTCLLAKRRARSGAGGHLCFNLTIHLIKKIIASLFCSLFND